MRKRILAWARALRREIDWVRAILRDPRTPWAAKLLLGLAVGYLLMPIDLIPDFIPVIGEIDDVIIVPLLLWLGLRLVPAAVRAEHRLAQRS